MDLSTDSIKAGDLYAGLTLQRLQVFVAVADHGGFSTAAHYLALGQPTVSFHVKALEDLFRAKLVVYQHRRVHLTPAGEELYRVAVAMLRDAERLATSLRSIEHGQIGELRVGASIAFELAPFFERVIAPFCNERPGLRLSLQFGHSVQLAESVQAGQLHLAYVQNWRLPSGAVYEALHHARFVLMVAPHHALARKRSVSAEDVYEAGLITAPIYSQEWPHYEELLRSSGLDRYRIALEIDGVQTRLLAAQAGLGVMGVFVPPYADEYMSSLLRPITLGRAPREPEFGIVSQARDGASSAAAEFSAHLRQVTASDRLR
jgi:DNA-binding transcriptional LysR family regulator